MNLRRFYCVAAVAAVITACSLSSANAQVYGKGLIDKTIASIGNEHILLSQLEEELQRVLAGGMSIADEKNTRCQILEAMLANKLFLNQAKLDSLTVNADYVEATLNERVDDIMSRLGGQEEMERYFKKPLFRIKDEWRQLFNDQNLIEQEQQTVVETVSKLTPNEVKKFYKKVDKDSLPIIPTQYRISQILLYPSKEEATIRVKEQLLEFRQRILNGEKFSTLAALYSEDEGTAARGGELRMASKNIYEPTFADAAMALKAGQISQIVETTYGFHLIQMIERKGDMFNARHILLRPKYTEQDRNKAFKTLDSLRSQILADSISFERAARFYSQDTKSYLNGGQVVDENTGSILFEKDQLRPDDYNVLKDLKVGEISQPFESTDAKTRGQVVYKIIKLDEIIPSHPANIEQDFVAVQNIAQTIEQNKAIDEFISQKQKITYIKIDEMFRDCKFERSGWIK